MNQGVENLIPPKRRPDADAHPQARAFSARNPGGNHRMTARMVPGDGSNQPQGQPPTWACRQMRNGAPGLFRPRERRPRRLKRISGVRDGAPFKSRRVNPAFAYAWGFRR